MNDTPHSHHESFSPRPATQTDTGIAASCLARLLFYAGLILATLLVALSAFGWGSGDWVTYSIRLEYTATGASANLWYPAKNGAPEGFISLAAAILIGSGWLLRQRQFSLRYFLIVLAAIVVMAIAGRKVEGYGHKEGFVWVRFPTPLDPKAQTRLKDLLADSKREGSSAIGPYADTSPPYAYSVSSQFAYSHWALWSDCQNTGRQFAPQWIQLCNEIAKAHGMPVIDASTTRIHTEPQMPGKLD